VGARSKLMCPSVWPPATQQPANNCFRGAWPHQPKEGRRCVSARNRGRGLENEGGHSIHVDATSSKAAAPQLGLAPSAAATFRRAQNCGDQPKSGNRRKIGQTPTRRRSLSHPTHFDLSLPLISFRSVALVRPGGVRVSRCGNLAVQRRRK